MTTPAGTPESGELTEQGGPEVQLPVPRIYVASLSDYNAGFLHGRWIDANQEPEEIQEQIAHMLAASPTTARYGDPAEEWAIHDYENFGPVRFGEYEPLDRVATIGSGISAQGEAFAAWVDLCGGEEDELDKFEECYLGEFETETAYGESLLEELGIDISELPGVPDSLRPYLTIDVAAWVRDMRYEGSISTAETVTGGVYVFQHL